VNQRFPWLTIGVLLVTALTTGAMLVSPQVGTTLERNAPRMLNGEPWRFVTTWLVETDGWSQIGINFLGLAVYGYLCERFIGWRWWILAYVVAGLAGEIAALWWQPVGGGNSVAICGLIGLFSMWQVRRQPQGLGPPRYAGFAFWLALGLYLLVRQDIHGAALVTAFIVGALVFARPRAELANG